MQQEPNAPWLSAEYREIFANQEAIRREFKVRDRALDYLRGIVTDLFIDWFRLRGAPPNDARRLLPQLQTLFLESDVPRLVQFFTQPL